MGSLRTEGRRSQEQEREAEGWQQKDQDWLPSQQGRMWREKGRERKRRRLGRGSRDMNVPRRMPERSAFHPFINSSPPSPAQVLSVLPLKPPRVCPVPLL